MAKGCLSFKFVVTPKNTLVALYSLCVNTIKNLKIQCVAGLSVWDV